MAWRLSCYWHGKNVSLVRVRVRWGRVALRARNGEVKSGGLDVRWRGEHRRRGTNVSLVQTRWRRASYHAGKGNAEQVAGERAMAQDVRTVFKNVKLNNKLNKTKQNG